MYLQKDKIKAITIGRFDGLHLGHKKIIDRLGKDGALVIIDKGGCNLAPKGHRENYLNIPCLYYKFEDIKDLSGEEFVELLKREFPNLKKIVVGYDFSFGKARSSHARDLKNMGDFEVEIVDECFTDGISVHSSAIRKYLSEGDLEFANKLLGRAYRIAGETIKGQGLGAKKLYPTLNLKIDRFMLPKDGVYASFTYLKDKIYRSVSFVGLRQSSDGEFAVETHILDESSIEKHDFAQIAFVKYLRENQKFPSLEELKKQISKDIQNAKQVLETCKI